jgi:hypothetical protein
MSAAATATATLSLRAREGETRYVSERSAIDALVSAQLELQKAEDAVRDNALAIEAAKRALSQAQSQKGMVEFNAFRKRKAVKEANDYVCDSLKSARQTAFKTRTQAEAKVYGAVPMVRLNACSSFGDPDASTTEEETTELGYEPGSPTFTPMTPPGSPKYVPTSPSQVPEWGQAPSSDEEN